MAGSPAPDDAYRMEVQREGQAAIVRLCGSMNMDVAEDLREKLIELIDEPVQQLILDLSQLDFISSLGLSGIIAAHLHTRDTQQTVKLACPKPAIQEILDITKLTQLVPTYPSVQAAVEDD
jgi:anti-anti-sigma factor